MWTVPYGAGMTAGVNLPVQDDKSTVRNPSEVRAMAVAVQANLVQLTVAESKRRGRRPVDHDIKVSAPGYVKHFRETLIDPKIIGGYSDLELHLRLREIWGRFCMMRWLFSQPEKQASVTFADLPEGIEMHCATALEVKRIEVNAFLWKMLFEQRRRAGPGVGELRLAEEDVRTADRIPAVCYGKPIEELNEEELLCASYEHAGMLAVIRWVLDKKLDWSSAEIMHAERPDFPPTD